MIVLTDNDDALISRRSILRKKSCNKSSSMDGNRRFGFWKINSRTSTTYKKRNIIIYILLLGDILEC